MFPDFCHDVLQGGYWLLDKLYCCATAVPQKSNKLTSHLKFITFLSTYIICRNIDCQYQVQADDLR
ncbi:hypothetical protein WP2S18C03_04920 [Aeromonas veronii]|nr:hypothetical protein WP2S18C03_04920 [Aeromonas veronii]